jgi:hypothetical protein
VNFNHEGHFHFAVGFFTGRSVDANDAFQMLERSRNLLDNTVHLCFEGIRPALPCLTVEAVGAQHANFRSRFTAHRTGAPGEISAEEAKVLSTLAGYGDMFEGRSDPDALNFALLRRDATYNILRSRAGFCQELLQRCKASGGRVLMCAPWAEMQRMLAAKAQKRAATPGVRKRHLARSARTNSQPPPNNNAPAVPVAPVPVDTQLVWATGIATARVLDDIEFEMLSADRSQTRADKAALDRYQIVACYGIDHVALTPQFVLERGQPYHMTMFVAFVDFAQDERDQSAIMASRIANGTHLLEDTSVPMTGIQELEAFRRTLGLTFGVDFEVTSGEQLDGAALAWITDSDREREHMTLFGDCARSRADLSGRFNAIDLYVRLLESTFPPLLTRPKKPHRPGGNGPRPRTYSYSWEPLRSTCALLHARLRRQKRTNIMNLKPWARQALAQNP